MRYFKLLCLLTSCVLASFAQSPLQEWLPVTQQDLEVKDAPGYPGAPAIQIYFSYYQNDNEKFISVYKRIKVLREAGRSYADVVIPLDPGQSLRQLQARTIHPDGAIIEFRDKVFEKIIVKKRGVKFAAETLTLPEVTVGSIVDYKYLIALPPHLVQQISSWPVQGELFTLKEMLRFKPYQGLVDVPTERKNVGHHTQVSYAYLNQVNARIPEQKGDHVMELQLDNVPPFHGEEYMPPEEDYRPTVLFYYGGRETASPDQFWDEWRRLWSESTEKFIGNYKEVRARTAEILAGETDPEKKLRKLYAAAQNIRNISFERERSTQERKREELKSNRTAADVLARGYGTGADIDLLMVAMARAAGFHASLLKVSDRSERSFNKMVLSLAQFGSDAVEVDLNGTTIVLDPGTVYCPFGMLRWKHAAAQALRLGSSGADFVTTPAPVNSAVQRSANLVLNQDGSVEGEVTVEIRGEEALEHRLEALETDEVGRRRSFEEEIQAWLPAGALVTMQDSGGWETPEAPLTARFRVEIPNFAATAGKRLVAPSFPFATTQKGMFKEDFRRFPIVFPYPFSETDRIVMKLPGEYELEAAPYHRKAGLSYAAYECTSSRDGDALTTERFLRFDGLNFPPETYPELKGFFSIVQAGDGGQAVLRRQQASSPD